MKSFAYLVLATLAACGAAQAPVAHPGGTRATAQHVLPEAPRADAYRCTIRISGTTVAVDGEPTTHDRAVAACRRGREAVVIGVAEPAWQLISRELEDANVTVIVRGVVGDPMPFDGFAPL